MGEMQASTDISLAIKLLLLITDIYLCYTFTYSVMHSLIVTSQSNSRDNISIVQLEVKDHAEASMASR